MSTTYAALEASLMLRTLKRPHNKNYCCNLAMD